jgi:Gpi18-like mannosyltransferase/predicted membrane-bound dolichyl-phosphate-mannose-protein mannosyltransferase
MLGPFPARTAAILGLLLALAPATARGAESIVQNGDFSHGTGSVPAEWRTDRWDTKAGVTDFLWLAPKGDQPGQVLIDSKKPNDARFVQDLRVSEQTWYHISAKVRTEDVGSQAIGAYLSLMEGFQNSNDLKGTETDWQPVELWVKTEKWQDRLTVALRLGGYSSLNTGKAWFTDVQAEVASGPPPNAKNVFQPNTAAGGVAPLGLWALILLLSLITGALWYYLRPSSGGPDGGSPGEKLGLVALLLAVLVAKMVAAPHFGFDTDLGTYIAWALRLADRGPADFYAPNYFCDYPPGYLYILWLVGSVYKGLEIATGGAFAKLIIKMPSLVTDLLTSWLLFSLLRSRVGRRATWVVVLAYTLNPAVIFNSAIWGQTDSFFTLLLFLGVLLLLEQRIAFGWALLMAAALTKPQALVFLPLLASWRGNWDRPERPIIAAAAGLATAALLVLPFIDPYGLVAHFQKGAAYYAETSVNAFNLMAILGGFRQSDSGMLLFMSFSRWALVLVLLFFGYLAYLISRRRDAEMYLYLCFLLPFGFFMLSTRMHERYLFPCLLFLTLLLPRRPRLWILFAGLTITYYVNLHYILDALNAERFLDKHELFPTLVSGANVLLFLWAMVEGWLLGAGTPQPLPLPEPAPAGVPSEGDPAAAGAPVAAAAAAKTPAAARRATPERARARATAPERPPPATRPRWGLAPLETGSDRFKIRRLDWALVLLLVLFAGGLRFWHLGQPDELVFDEVYFVEQGKNYLRGKEFMDPHPPLAKLAIGASVALFGGEASGYRVMNAICGTLLVGVAYLTGRKLLGDGVAAFATGLAVAVDGLFIVDSRIAVIDIWYVTFGAIAYLLLFEYLRMPPRARAPSLLIAVGVAVGLNLASKLFIPAFTWLTVVLFLTLASVARPRGPREPIAWERTLAPAALVTAAGGVAYLAVFLPHYFLGWWSSLWDIPKYFHDVVNYEAAVADATHPYSSKWWTWPFLLRPVWYHFKDVPGDASKVVGVWGGGNPLVWWGGFAAIVVTAVHAVRERAFTSAFLVAAFVLHYVVWSWIGRTLFQYHYLPSLYASILALAMVLAALWHAPPEEGFWIGAGVALLVPLLPTLIGPMPRWGVLVWAAIAAAYGAAIVYRRLPFFQWPPGRVVVVAYAVIGIVLLVYFYPIWSGIPISRDMYSSRMWFQGGPARWI